MLLVITYIIGADSRILSSIKISDNVVFGSNFFVIRDVHPNCIVAEIPTIIIIINIKVEDYV
ncbi:hypothetical protein FACS189426_20930 [Bacteroidia bacterium]|nr:hypothetical protein FACS189426_20930 [Bacteroidia bacterium]GHV70283.1 hypothetical protein FACS189420_0730 [Bacteroidia bacterium]